MGIELIVQYFDEPRPARHAEYHFCLLKNLENPFVERVHNLGLSVAIAPAELRSHPKWRDVVLGHRMTFEDAFRYASDELAGKCCGICNLDIFLDAGSDWPQAEALLRREKLVLCQSRVEFTPPAGTHLDPSFARLAHATAQDAWLFIAPIAPPAIDFEIGTLGCDNAVAERIRRIGYIPINLGSRFRVLHYDLIRGKNGTNIKDIHKAETQQRGVVYSRFPEREGCYLVPDFDRVGSLDQLATDFGFGPLEKYQLICEMMSRFVKIEN